MFTSILGVSPSQFGVCASGLGQSLAIKKFRGQHSASRSR